MPPAAALLPSPLQRRPPLSSDGRRSERCPASRITSAASDSAGAGAGIVNETAPSTRRVVRTVRHADSRSGCGYREVSPASSIASASPNNAATDPGENRSRRAAQKRRQDPDPPSRATNASQARAAAGGMKRSA
ncbi:MAG: hypothetical protein R3F11_21175 [Verrucomicrobiales bacterium]